MKDKEVWVFHHYADPPDGHWTGTYDLYKFLVKEGNRVTVFSSSFSHYTRLDERLAEKEKARTASYDGVEFVFVKATPHVKNDWRRIANMLTYAFRSHRAANRHRGRPDVVVGCTPHPFCALAGKLQARRHGVPFVLELHDLWLEYLKDTGGISAWNPVAAIWQALDRLLYKKANKILALWPNMKARLAQLKIPEEKVVWMPLGVDLDDNVAPEPTQKGDGEPFLVMFTGSIGPASNLGEVVQAARILQERGQNHITFSLIGAGPDRNRLIKFSKDAGLKNLEFPGLVPKDEVASRLAAADACICGLPDVRTYNEFGTIPTKLLDYMSSNRPTIFISNVKDNMVVLGKAGYAVPPEQPEALVEVILKLAAMSVEERSRFGRNGLDYVNKNHNLRLLSGRLSSVLEEVMQVTDATESRVRPS